MRVYALYTWGNSSRTFHQNVYFFHVFFFFITSPSSHKVPPLPLPPLPLPLPPTSSLIPTPLEDKIREILTSLGATPLAEIPVMDFRPDVVDWYERQGYTKTGSTRPFPATDIMLDGYNINFVILSKQL